MAQRLRKLFRGFVFLIFLINGSHALASDYTVENINSFADYLFDNEDYYRAITEYERVIFMFPNHPLSNKARFQIGMAYLMGEKWEIAINHFENLVKNYHDQEIGKQSFFMIAETYYKKKDYQQAIGAYKDFLENYSDDHMHDEAHIRLGWSFLRINNINKAQKEFRSVSTYSPKRAEAEKVAQEVIKINDAPHKSPLVAASLSAILPGLGQLYAERPGDATVSFLLNGLFIWGIVEAFNNGNNALGIILTGVGLGWYTGNIYNATNNAYKFNQREKIKLIDGLEYKYDLSFTCNRDKK